MSVLWVKLEEEPLGPGCGGPTLSPRHPGGRARAPDLLAQPLGGAQLLVSLGKAQHVSPQTQARPGRQAHG